MTNNDNTEKKEKSKKSQRQSVTTTLDKDLLKLAKLEAVHDDKNLNDILEKALTNYFKEKKQK